jgi:hypothetical protein
MLYDALLQDRNLQGMMSDPDAAITLLARELQHACPASSACASQKLLSSQSQTVHVTWLIPLAAATNAAIE